MNQGWIYRDQIKLAQAGLTLLDYYAQHYPHSSPDDWHDRITTQQILVDGKPATATTRLQPGQQLTYHRPPWQELEVPLGIEVLHEDPDLLVVAKPAGLPVLPGGGFLEHTLLHQLQQRYPQGRPFPIHRLGRGTSGLLLLARSPQSRAHLSHQMRQHQIQKTYLALVGAMDMPDLCTITEPIGKLPHPILGYVYGVAPEGLPAHSEVTVLQRQAETTLLSVLIRTGRPHQIRIHLAAAGYPLVGDPLYGPGGLPLIPPPASGQKLPVPGDCGYHLHAYHLALIHPSTGQPFQITCPPPAELQVGYPERNRSPSP